MEDTKERLNEAEDEKKKFEIDNSDLKKKIDTAKKEKEDAVEHLKVVFNFYWLNNLKFMFLMVVIPFRCPFYGLHLSHPSSN